MTKRKINNDRGILRVFYYHKKLVHMDFYIIGVIEKEQRMSFGRVFLKLFGNMEILNTFVRIKQLIYF